MECKQCTLDLDPLKDFYFHKKSNKPLQPCKACRAKRSHDTHKANRDYFKRFKRLSQIDALAEELGIRIVDGILSDSTGGSRPASFHESLLYDYILKRTRFDRKPNA